MDDGRRAGLNLDDSERLPWLEPAGPVDDGEAVSLGKIVGLVLVGLALVGVIIGGGYWLKHRKPGADGEARLIPAQGGDYKIAANESGGKAFQGEGDTSYATSEGVDTDGKVDASRMPEAPMAGVSRGSIAKDDSKREAAPTKPANSITAAVRDETRAKPGAASASAVSSGGAMVQLGAYGSEAVAQDAWKKLSRRFDYLAALPSTVQKAEVGGSTVYRLRAGAGSAANAGMLCGRLKVAGENCIVVK